MNTFYLVEITTVKKQKGKKKQSIHDPIQGYDHLQTLNLSLTCHSVDRKMPIFFPILIHWSLGGIRNSPYTNPVPYGH